MLYTGEFMNLHGVTIGVRIITGDDTSETVAIGTEAAGVWFADEPVSVTSGVNSPTDHLLRHGAEIRLLARDFRPDLFCRTAREARVTVTADGACVFAGYIEPQTYSQPYNEIYDEISLNCIDALSALQYIPYGGSGADYPALRRSASLADMWSLIRETLSEVCHRGEPAVYYDRSRTLYGKGVTNSDNIFSQILISELLFLGDGEDDVWTMEEVLEEIMRYLNLHILQQGTDFYIFAWESLARSGTLEFRSLTGGATQTFPRAPKVMTSAMAADTDARISIEEVYNRIELTCDTTPMDSLVENPLDGSDLTSPYTSRQLYMDDCLLPVGGLKEQEAWRMLTDMMEGRPVQRDGAKHSRWYLRVMDHPGWSFPGGTGVPDMVEAYCRGNADQQRLPRELSRRIAAGLISWGKEDLNVDGKDDAVTGKISMGNALVINVPGNDYISEDLAYPDAEALLAASPVAVYEGNTSGGLFSPADDDTVNYIVFSGKITLNPVALVTLANNGAGSSRATVPGPEEGTEYYRAQRFYKAASPTAAPAIDPECGCSYPPKATSQALLGGGCLYSWPGLQPYTDTGMSLYRYSYGSAGDWSDTIPKLGVVACMLVIGGKCLVEGKHAAGAQKYDGDVSRYTWETFRERSQCASDDEYYAQSFTIGINPKLGDCIIGTEFAIGNNITLGMGLDMEGMAVPIRRADRLSGAVRFEILGPVNLMWDVVTRRHATWFRHTQWTTDTRPVLPSLSNIIISDFSVTLQSDNGRTDLLREEDLVYVSDTDETFENVMDDLTFRFTSALTAEEAQEAGVHAGMLLSTPCASTTPRWPHSWMRS